MKILITGATGLIGSKIVKDCLKKDIQVNFLTTSKAKINSIPGSNGFFWDPEKNIINTKCFEDVDSIINLSGASIFRLWTKKNKELILNSRVKSLNFLKEKIIENNIKINSLVSASGISAYPSSYEKQFDETENKIGDHFLSSVIGDWETATNSFNQIIENVSIVRIGLVLSKSGGVLKQTMQSMKFGFGIYFGSGKQWQSWIHIDDISRLFIYITSQRLSGTYNGVAPNPISNYMFTKIISEVKKYVLFLIPMPRFFFKMIFGEMHNILFESQKVSSKKIENKGFKFKFNILRDAIENILQ